MSFSPRSMLVTPSQFGRVSDPKWRPVGAELHERSRAAVALLQHQLALGIRDDIYERDITRRAFAAELGVPEGTLNRKLCGADLMTSTDLAMWVLHVGRIEMWPVPNNLSDLLPSG